MQSAGAQEKKLIILVGASVGGAWNIAEISKRRDIRKYNYEYVGCYSFDKTEALERILRRKGNKPAAIILKECAAYFPSDVTVDEAKSLMKRWITWCEKEDVIPIPATVAPVTKSRDDRYRTHNILKRVVKTVLGISMKTQMQRIVEYNDWLREYSEGKGLVVLDLEEALRMSGEDRFLRNDLGKDDGLHLNEMAYSILDDTLIETVQKVPFIKRSE